MEKKVLKKLHQMDMRQFLIEYYGIDNDDLIKLFCNATHKELKMIAPFYGINLVKTSFDYVTMQHIKTGAIILVSDCLSRPAPYINPLRLLENDEYDTELGSFDYVIKEEYNFDKKGRVKTLKKTNMRRDDKYDKY